MMCGAFVTRPDSFHSKIPPRTRPDSRRPDTGAAVGNSPENTAGPITCIVRPEATNS